MAWFEKKQPSKRHNFPWYLIYTPIITIAALLWYWEAQTGENVMDIVQLLLTWADVDEKTKTSIVIVCFAVIALLYTVGKWFATSQKLKQIESNVAHIPSEHREIKASITATKEDIQNSISLARSDTQQMNQRLDYLLSPKVEYPVLRGKLLTEISELYELHDKDKDKIADLERENADLKKQVHTLERELSGYRKLSCDDRELER